MVYEEHRARSKLGLVKREAERKLEVLWNQGKESLPTTGIPPPRVEILKEFVLYPCSSLVGPPIYLIYVFKMVTDICLLRLVSVIRFLSSTPAS